MWFKPRLIDQKHDRVYQTNESHHIWGLPPLGLRAFIGNTIIPILYFIIINYCCGLISSPIYIYIMQSIPKEVRFSTYKNFCKYCSLQKCSAVFLWLPLDCSFHLINSALNNKNHEINMALIFKCFEAMRESYLLRCISKSDPQCSSIQVNKNQLFYNGADWSKKITKEIALIQIHSL